MKHLTILLILLAFFSCKKPDPVAPVDPKAREYCKISINGKNMNVIIDSVIILNRISGELWCHGTTDTISYQINTVGGVHVTLTTPHSPKGRDYTGYDITLYQNSTYNYLIGFNGSGFIAHTIYDQIPFSIDFQLKAQKNK